MDKKRRGGPRRSFYEICDLRRGRAGHGARRLYSESRCGNRPRQPQRKTRGGVKRARREDRRHGEFHPEGKRPASFGNDGEVRRDRSDDQTARQRGHGEFFERLSERGRRDLHLPERHARTEDRGNNRGGPHARLRHRLGCDFSTARAFPN